MNITNELLRRLPKVGNLLESPQGQSLLEVYNRKTVKEALEEELNTLRKELLSGREDIPEMAKLLARAQDRISSKLSGSPRRVLNATGVVIHTNLGRAPLAKEAQAAAMEASGYCNLEIDLASGERGSRHVHVEDLLVQLTGAEAAMVVNNNAAAVLLALGAVAKGGDGIISRGQLVEIGGSFRVPDVMAQSGVALVEVGTTNKTYIDDYRRAITPETAVLLRVHPSNYRVLGFQREVTLEELVSLGQEHDIPVLDDLGSGTLIDLSPWGIDEPTVQQSVKAGADVICFSGDKLLGGPQCGIIVGKEAWISKLKKHPLARALRCDKVTLATLSATLSLYFKEDGWRQVPVLSMITQTLEEVEQRALELKQLLKDLPVEVQVLDAQSPVGGGALPLHRLETKVVGLRSQGVQAHDLAFRLRQGNPGIVGRVQEQLVLLDVRTLTKEDLSLVARGVAGALGVE